MRPLTYWITCAFILAIALTISAMTVGRGDQVGAALTIGSLLLAGAWIAAALWAGTGVRILPHDQAGWAWSVGLSVACSAAFVLGAVVFIELGWLEDEIGSLTNRAEETSLALTWLVAALAGAAEEAYFRGSVYSWLRGRAPVLSSTLLYAAAMSVTGQFALVIAAAGLGLAAALARALSDSLFGPVLVHLVWTTAMLALLPQLIA